uniref:C-type lectin domain-containing protein n=1 Tax=Naja naja TaxID=35670 RepID=A0A8C6VT16_NAJNA
MMSPSSRPNIQTMLQFLMLLQLALEVSLQETSTSSTSPQDWLQNACTLIMCAPNKGDPRREMAIQGLQQFSSPSELLALSAPNRDKLGTGTSELELLKLQVKELRIQMDILKATFIKVQQAILAPNGRIVGDKMFKRDDSKGDFLAATTKCTHMNSKLALPRNVAENSALQEIVAFRNEQTILGITYNAAKRKFEDLNGHPLQFSNWAPGEPNNLGYEKCVEMHPNGQWHNRICDLGWSIICEVDI